MLPPPGSTSTTECRAVGVVPNDKDAVKRLSQALRALCAKYAEVRIYEAVLSIPGRNSNIKMIKKNCRREPPKENPFQEKISDRWCMLWESDPLRGPLFKELPAAVREVCESQCFCNNAPEFWQALGARFEYDMIKQGNEYICFHAGFEIKVQYLSILSLEIPGKPDGPTKHAANRYIIDVSTRVPEGRHVEGARAVGSFGGLLQPLVVLQRAEKPIG